MLDTSLIERKIHGKVMNLCFESIVSEAFISGLPIAQEELTDGLTQSFARYACECLEDLGGSALLQRAMETPMEISQKAYVRKIYEICNETATNVTARILKENEGNDEALKKEAENVTLTQSEYDKFSKAASTLTPDTLSKMIQKKTLDTIKEEQEAYKKDAELEVELVNALNVSDEEVDAEEDVPQAMQDGGDAQTGANIGQSEEQPLNESFVGDQNDANKKVENNITGEEIGMACPCPEHNKEEAKKDPTKHGADAPKAQVGQQGMEFYDPGVAAGLQSIQQMNQQNQFMQQQQQFMNDMQRNAQNHANQAMNVNVSFQKYMYDENGKKLSYDDLVKQFKEYSAEDLKYFKTVFIMAPPTMRRALNQAYDEVRRENPGSIKEKNSKGFGFFRKRNDKKATEAFESYMKSIAGSNYRTKHSSVFSKLQELAYEGVLATTESYSDIPFETMAAITKENTFESFASHRGKNFQATMESIARYDFANESMATPDGANTALNTGLLTASIIYTFFETLNSMNLYCPKLDEIRNFVDENLPIADKVAIDKRGFEDLFKKVIADATNSVRTASTVPEVDAIQRDLEVVREKIAAPGFESARKSLNEAIESLQNAIDHKRDGIIASQQPKAPAVESYFDTVARTRDVLKFDRISSLMGKKPNVQSIRCKVDPQGQSKYIAVEAFGSNGNVVGKSTIVLESATGDLTDYVMGAMKSSKIMDCGKKIMLTDSRSGKMYLDSTRL